MIAAIIAIIASWVLYRIFVKGPRGSRSFVEYYNDHKRSAQHVQDKGGPSVLYAKWVSFFRQHEYTIREIYENGLEMTRVTDAGKSTVQLVAIDEDSSELQMGFATRAMMHEGSSQWTQKTLFTPSSKPEEVTDECLEAVCTSARQAGKDAIISVVESIFNRPSPPDSQANKNISEDSSDTGSTGSTGSTAPEASSSARNQWNQAIEAGTIGAHSRPIVEAFFIPDQIDGPTFLANIETIKKQSMMLSKECKALASTILVNFFLMGNYVPSGWPRWFVAAYPEVFMWVLHGSGNGYFEELLRKEMVSNPDEPDADHKLFRSIVDIYKRRRLDYLVTSAQYDIDRLPQGLRDLVKQDSVSLSELFPFMSIAPIQDGEQVTMMTYSNGTFPLNGEPRYDRNNEAYKWHNFFITDAETYDELADTFGENEPINWQTLYEYGVTSSQLERDLDREIPLFAKVEARIQRNGSHLNVLSSDVLEPVTVSH